MPHITTAMEGSMRRSNAGIAALNSLLGRRDISGTVGGVKNTFSSWDNCMAQSYCKWPVIAAIIVAGLIIFSIVWCVIRCACCGMSCCCTCFSFLKCCDCCGGSCDGRKNKPMKHLDDSYSHHGAPGGGYRAPEPMPMMGGARGGKPDPPQFAQFDIGKNGLAVERKPSGLSEDALPPMPSWDTSNKKQVENDEKDAVELSNLDPSVGHGRPQAAASPIPGQAMSPSPAQELAGSPYGARPGQGMAGNGYMGVAGGDPYSGGPRNHNSPGGYRGSPAPSSRNGTPGPDGFYRGSPSPGPGRAYGALQPQEMHGDSSYVGMAVSPGPGYGRGPRNGGFPGDNNNRRGPPQRQMTGDSNPYFPPQPYRQHSNDARRPLMRQGSDMSYNNGPPPRGPSRGPGGPVRLASPPVNNNSGFDFGPSVQQYSPYSTQPPAEYTSSPQESGYARGASPPRNPQNGGYDSYEGTTTAPPSYASRSPPRQEPSSYTTYKPYQPPEPSNSGSNHQRAPTALRPGPKRLPTKENQPQVWDPVSQ